MKTADGKVTQYAYNDKTGDLSRIDLPSGKSIVYKYNSEGDTTAVSDGTKNLFDYVYDADGKLTEVKDSTNSKSKRYSYENTLTNSAGDGQGRLMSITDYFGINQSYKYVTGIDSIKTDLPSSMTFNGVESIYSYDKVNRLDKVEVSGNKWLFRHDELGRVNQTKLPMNTGSVDYEFGDNGAIESIVSETGVANVVNDQYSYDQYGNMSKKQSNGVVSTYQYDAMDQLTEEKIGDKTFSYTYDKRGNRTSVNGTNATFNIMNQLTQFGSESISYDADGNRTGDGKFTYEWDAVGQMTRLTEKSTGETWSYQYDEHGRRITKVHNGTTIRYHYDSDTNHLMAESQDGQVIRQYIRDQEGNLLGLKVNGTYYSYHKNYRGDIIGITDMSGNLQASYEYDSWGNVLKEDVKDTNLKNQPFRYASYFYDTESSQYYLMARYYHPKHGVFLSVDPELGTDETVGMHNGYNYANNNTVRNIDPSGRAWQSADQAGGYGSNNIGGGVSISPRIRVVRVSTPKSYRVNASSLKQVFNNVRKDTSRFRVSNKHLNNAGGRYVKFNTSQKSKVNKWIREALNSERKRVYRNKNKTKSYYVVANLHKKIGTRGEKRIKIVFGADGKIWTAYPLK
ncbi:RHS repeat domain-containing protein [Macrococcus equipercicus]|uniref:RHS repeat-associated core domain-containing protein n=1 Tax=Macrococcus equipercicus TaxID=69967 RepID=A0A9Q9BUH2_9STAP|nr:RHS repeat-associated core domain-containing protein [Macrococcus equipercicus]UTH14709.1 RHS repeat-associated core domain-containing protein [Macrococcus equipercicus]